MKDKSKDDTLIDFNSLVIPAAKVTSKIFAILDPITFPTEISGEFFYDCVY